MYYVRISKSCEISGYGAIISKYKEKFSNYFVLDFNKYAPFYGAMRCLCERLINNYPDADIVFMTPLHRETENAEIKENALPSEIPPLRYVSIIKDYGLSVLDLFNASEI